jgi:hypothetical protein
MCSYETLNHIFGFTFTLNPEPYLPLIMDICLVSQEVAEEPKRLGPDALLRQKVKQKRFRDGYEEGLSTLHRATPAAAFLASEQPVEMLGQFSRSVTTPRIRSIDPLPKERCSAS